jgi:hypothetical protein
LSRLVEWDDTLMSRSIGRRMPDPIFRLIDGTDLEQREGSTFLLLTTTQEGWPHVAMLSVGEVLAVGPSELRIAVWSTSSSTANLTHRPRATLVVTHAGTGYYLRCLGRRGQDLETQETGHLAVFHLQIDDVLEDAVPYAWIESGITFRLRVPEQVYPRWHTVIELLRGASVPSEASSTMTEGSESGTGHR